MFDRTLVQHDTNVYVKQQPNDAADAARLHGEIRDRAEAEARGAIVARFGARNELVGVKFEHQRRFLENTMVVRLLFKINGETFDIVVEDNCEAMTKAAYQEIALRMVAKVVDSMMPKLR